MNMKLYHIIATHIIPLCKQYKFDIDKFDPVMAAIMAYTIKGTGREGWLRDICEVAITHCDGGIGKSTYRQFYDLIRMMDNYSVE